MANCQNNMRYGRQMNFNSRYNAAPAGNSSHSECRNMPINNSNECRNMPARGSQSGCVTPMPKKDCQCRYDVLEDFPLAMAYVPWQRWQNIFEPCKALECGTIFEELWKPFRGKGGCNR